MYQTELNSITLFNAPEEYDYDELGGIGPEKVIKIFLAGGITGCADWQSECIGELNDILLDDHVMVFNPRRKDFDTGNSFAAAEQIEWEFRRLEEMDIFSMYFAASETSVGPICLYELGRYLCRMQMRFPSDWSNRIVISVEEGYSRKKDVIEQVRLAAPELIEKGHVAMRADPVLHANMIVSRVRYLKRWYPYRH